MKQLLLAVTRCYLLFIYYIYIVLYLIIDLNGQVRFDSLVV